ncbi:MAG: hypothetical protein IKV29_01585 [Alistipes sp.]|nr:hypothetical protein [Alistipes sp.]
MSQIAKFQADLDPNHKLFNYLRRSAPSWWHKILNYRLTATAKSGVYVDIRKDNTINVYYQGASLAKIEWHKGGVVATTHHKYLGIERCGKTVYYPCEEQLEILGQRECYLLRNAEASYTNKDGREELDAEKKCEKRLQGEVVCSSPGMYIDSEFAHRYQEDSRHTIRIDLVRVVDNTLQFVELKRIQDPRLLCKDVNVTPEIITQMEEYRRFLEANSESILDYYRGLIEIKRSLGLLLSDIDVDRLKICTMPRLEIHNLYRPTLKHFEARRRQRIERIESHLKAHNIDYCIK